MPDRRVFRNNRAASWRRRLLATAGLVTGLGVQALPVTVINPAPNIASHTGTASDRTGPGSGVQRDRSPSIPIRPIPPQDGGSATDVLAAVPEPDPWALTLAGIGAVVLIARRSRPA